MSPECIRDFKLVLMAVEYAMDNEKITEEEVLTLATHYGEHFNMTQEKAAKLLDVSLRDLLSGKLTGVGA